MTFGKIEDSKGVFLQFDLERDMRKMKKQNKPIIVTPITGFRDDNMEIDFKDAGINTDLHWHDHYELEVITEGSGTYYINGVEYPMTRGSAYLVTPVDFHRISGEFSLYHIFFNDRMVSDEILNLIASASCSTVVQFEESELVNIANALACLEQEYRDDKPMRESVMKSLLEYALLCHLRRSAPLTDEQGRADVTVLRVVSYIKFHFKNKLTLSEVAKAVELSPNYVGEIFSRRMGVSFNQYLMQTRLSYAKNLLSKGGMSVQDVARDSGFSSQTYFSDSFRRQFGYTPTDVKKQGEGDQKA